MAAGTRGEPAARRGDNCPRAGTSEPRHLPRTCAAPLQPAPLLPSRSEPPAPKAFIALQERDLPWDSTARLPPERSGVLGGSSTAGLQKVGVRSNRARRKPQTITCLLLEGTNDTGLSLPSSFLPSGAPSPSAPVGSGVCGGRWGRRGLKLPFSKSHEALGLSSVPAWLQSQLELSGRSQMCPGGAGLPAQGLG